MNCAGRAIATARARSLRDRGRLPAEADALRAPAASSCGTRNCSTGRRTPFSGSHHAGTWPYPKLDSRSTRWGALRRLHAPLASSESIRWARFFSCDSHASRQRRAKSSSSRNRERDLGDHGLFNHPLEHGGGTRWRRTIATNNCIVVKPTELDADDRLGCWPTFSTRGRLPPEMLSWVTRLAGRTSARK